MFTNQHAQSSDGRFNQTHCSLDDVFGASGLSVDDSEALARRLSDTLGEEWRSPVEGAAPTILMTQTGGGGVGAFSPRGQLLGARVRAINSAVFGDSASTVVRDVVTTGGHHQAREQRVGPFRVVGATWNVSLSTAGDLTISGAPVADLKVRTPERKAGISRTKVSGAIREQLGLSNDVEISIERVLFPLDGTARWAYCGRGIVEENSVDLVAYVDALDLSLLVSQDVSFSAIGTGSVFKVNPKRNRKLLDVELPDLAEIDPRVLRGAAFDVRQANPPRASRGDDDWRVDKTSPLFDDVSAYYHLTSARRYFESLLGPNLFERPLFKEMSVKLGDRGSRDSVAKFIPSKVEIRFGDGKRSGARCGDICTHEFTHVVFFAAKGISDISTPIARAFNEGFADYFQASLHDKPLFGDWVEPKRARDCSAAVGKIPSVIDEPGKIYPVGTLWAGVLWKLRGLIGAPAADRIAAETMVTFDDGDNSTVAFAKLTEAGRRIFPSPADGGAGLHDDAIATSLNLFRE